MLRRYQIDAKNEVEKFHRAVDSDDYTLAVACTITILQYSRCDIIALLSIERSDKWQKIGEIVVMYLEGACNGTILSISEHCKQLTSFLSFCKNGTLWKRFIEDLLFSYEKGTFHFMKHKEMLRAAHYLDTHSALYPKVTTLCDSPLSFLFCIVPSFVLHSFPDDLINIINSSHSFESSFLSFVLEDAGLFTSWLTAGIALFCRNVESKEHLNRLSTLLSKIDRPCEAFAQCKESDIVDLMRWCVKDEICLRNVEQLIRKDLFVMFCVVFGSSELAERTIPFIKPRKLCEVCQRCFFYGRLVDLPFSQQLSSRAI